MRELLGIRDNIVAVIPATLPTIINEDVLIACIAEASTDHCIRHFLDNVFTDITAEQIPRHPSHRRCLRQFCAIGNMLCLSLHAYGKASYNQQNKFSFHNIGFDNEYKDSTFLDKRDGFAKRTLAFNIDKQTGPLQGGNHEGPREVRLLPYKYDIPPLPQTNA